MSYVYNIIYIMVNKIKIVKNNIKFNIKYIPYI